MILLIISIIVSIVPTILIVILLKKRKDDVQYKKLCNGATIRGAIGGLPVIAMSGALYFLLFLLKKLVFPDINVLLDKAIYAFIVLAFVEELVKFLMLSGLLKKEQDNRTWTDVVAYMIIIGGMFGVVETMLYIVNLNPGVLIARAISFPHVGYALIMGWFYAMGLYKGKKSYPIIGLLISFFIHGLYDYSLTPELVEVSELFMLLSFGLVLVDIVLVVLMIVFFAKVSKKPKYNEILNA